MNLFDTAQTIKRWINNCDRQEQLDLLAHVIEEFVHKRFARETPYFELTEAIADLAVCIEKRLTIILRP